MSVRKGLFFLMLFPLAAWAQVGVGAPGLGSTLKPMEANTWAVFGRTTDMKGNPLGGVAVRVDVGVGIGSVRSVKTNLQGEFRTEFTLDASMHKHLTCQAGRYKIRLQRGT